MNIRDEDSRVKIFCRDKAGDKNLHRCQVVMILSRGVARPETFCRSGVGPENFAG